jgi:hypothetical protein
LSTLVVHQIKTLKQSNLKKKKKKVVVFLSSSPAVVGMFAVTVAGLCPSMTEVRAVATAFQSFFLNVGNKITF